jgi:hypothetical protein
MYLESILYVCHPAALDIITGEIKCLQHKDYMLQILNFQYRGHLLMMELVCSKQVEDSTIKTNNCCSFYIYIVSVKIWQHISTSEGHHEASSINYIKGIVYIFIKFWNVILFVQFDETYVAFKRVIYKKILKQHRVRGIFVVRKPKLHAPYISYTTATSIYVNTIEECLSNLIFGKACFVPRLNIFVVTCIWC